MRMTKWFSVMLTLATAVQTASADDRHDGVQITVNVTITAPTCSVNNNEMIDIDFGSDIAVPDVAAGTVEKPIVYVLDCSKADAEKSLKMTIGGAVPEFNGELLKTSMDDLGVQIKANGEAYPINTDFNFATDNEKPVLTALLVQKPGSQLEAGAFTAGATMTVDYQ